MSSVFGGGGANKQTKAYQAQQAAMAAQQMQMYRDVAPQYMKGIDYWSQRAGFGGFHPSDFGSSTPAPMGGEPIVNPASMPGSTMGSYNPQDRLANLGSQYNPPPQQAGAWNWSAPGQQAMAPSATIPQSKDDKTRDLILGGQGDGPAQLGPNPYPTSTPTQPNAPAAPTPSAVTPPPRPQSNMQQYMQATPGMRPFNASAGSIGNHQSEGAYNAHPSASGAQAAGSMGPSPYTGGPPASGGVTNNQMGVFNDPADALRNAQAQDDINHQEYLQQQQMKSQMGGRGLEDSSVLGAGLGQLSQNALQNYAGYRRNLAMNAQQQQDNYVSQMMGSLNPGFGSGQQSASNYGGLTQQSFQQQQASQNALQQLFGSIGSYLGMGGLGGGYSNPMATYNQSGMSNIG